MSGYFGVDKYLGRRRQPTLYNCAHFVREVWEDLFNEDLQGALSCFLVPPSEREAPVTLRSYFQRLDKPQSPCIVLMTHPAIEPHIGLMLGKKVLHLGAKGVEYVTLDLATRGYRSYRLYGLREDHP